MTNGLYTTSAGYPNHFSRAGEHQVHPPHTGISWGLGSARSVCWCSRIIAIPRWSSTRSARWRPAGVRPGTGAATEVPSTITSNVQLSQRW